MGAHIEIRIEGSQKIANGGGQSSVAISDDNMKMVHQQLQHHILEMKLMKA